MLDKKRGGRLQRDYTPQKATLQIQLPLLFP